MNDLSKQIIIKCPKCGYEYLASEIFYPDDIFGTCDEVLRDENGHILLVAHGSDPQREEPWTCDHCGCEFTARLTVKGESIYNDDLDFSEDFTINSNSDKVQLF